MFSCKKCAPKRSSHIRFHIDGYSIRECDQCHHRFADPQPDGSHTEKVYSDAYFTGGGAGYPDYLTQSALLKKRGKYYGLLVNKYMPQGKLLDVGSAAGFLLQGFLETGWKGMGVEPNRLMAAYGNTHLGVKIECTALEDFQTDQTFDLISMVQVLPHFYDLNRAFARLEKLTAPGGYWLIETWNKDSLTAKLAGKNWHEYAPPSVLHWFTPKTILHFTSSFGMEFVAKGRPKKNIQGEHIKSFFTHKYENTMGGAIVKNALRLLPDTAVLPYPAEDLFWILLKKNE